ncbi:hypothetical protein J416_12467 [Gracilibacillus halophilus YIM-C55.5]|uniref:Uncharacterized protein n=1 Tax=Gracilibacillus halophilus YIM-C55.5 TaxID=1308866 RepID=N4W7B4_9BACI|nr:hypothetical protein [Gracilibacillus halophilus]ENH96133.1 hypothetical protein J416_12467 [Gracilibacillus halophilus YIM-C55.5]
MTKKIWKSYAFLILSILVTLTFIGLFFIGFDGGKQSLLNFMVYQIYLLGIASLIMGGWSFISKLALKVSTIIASVLTITNIFMFLFFF